MNQEFINALNQLQAEKNIDKDELFDAIETSIVSAYQKNYKENPNVEINLNRENGEITVYEKKTVVDEVLDPNNEISIEEVREEDPNLGIGDIYRVAITPKDFGRIAAQNAKQLIIQRIKEAERNLLYDEFKDRIGEALNGTITRIDRGNVYVNLGNIEGYLPQNEQLSNETYQRGQRLKVYLVNIKNNAKGTQLKVSRTHPDFIKRLFEEEIPEIYEGLIDIESIARDPGVRTKVAVVSQDNTLDPIGACIGPKGSRIQNILNEINGERIDVVQYSKDIKDFIRSALSPATINRIIINEGKRSAIVIVDDSQLALAIGKEGKNVQLAARLTGWKVDIKSEEQFQKLLEENPNYEIEFTEATKKTATKSALDELIKAELNENVDDLLEAEVESSSETPSLETDVNNEGLNELFED